MQRQGGFVPPAVVSAAAAEGLVLRDRNGGGSIATATRARQLAGGEPISLDAIYRMSDFFQSFSKAFGQDCAFLLNGGDAGKAWVASVITKLPAETSWNADGIIEKALPDPQELRRQVNLILESNPAGAPLEAFRAHVQKHGYEAVGNAITSLNAGMLNGFVSTLKPLPIELPEVQKAIDEPAAKERPWRPFRFRTAEE